MKPSISGGLKNLSVASTSSHIVNTQIKTILTRVPKISALWYPKDNPLEAGR